MSNFWQRLFSGAVFVAALVSAIILGGWYVHVLFGIITFFGLQEFYQMFKKSVVKPDEYIGTLFGILIYAVGVYVMRNTDQYKILLVICLLSFLTIMTMELFRKKKHPFENCAITLFGIAYIVVPFLLLNHLTWIDHQNNAVYPVMGIFIMVWSNDTFAYLVGRKFGKRKLFERISPKKSWEGFFGGLIFSMLAAVVIALLADKSLNNYLVLAVIISVFGTIGDLIESMLKRSLNVKDSGSIMPGHGGILDRFDAILFITPIIYLMQEFVF